jgi:hypothetical protein
LTRAEDGSLGGLRRPIKRRGHHRWVNRSPSRGLVGATSHAA